MTVADAITELVEFINRVEHGVIREPGCTLDTEPTEGEVAAMWRLIALGKAAMAWTAMTEDDADEILEAQRYSG